MVPVQARRADKRVKRLVSENRNRNNRAVPYNKKSKAVLGAIGMPPGQSAVNQGMADTQPIRAKRLSAIAREEKSKAK